MTLKPHFFIYFFLIFNLCERTKLKDKHTKELFSQHGELLFVEASPGKCGELPAEDLRELAPAGPRRVPKESQVLWRKVEKVREAVKHKKWKQTSPKQLENMSCSYRRTRVNGTSAEFVVTLWKSKIWNLSQFSSCLAVLWGWITRFICNLCHFDAVNRTSVLGKPILETWKMQNCPVKIRTTEVDWKNKIYVSLFIIIFYFKDNRNEFIKTQAFNKDVQVCSNKLSWKWAYVRFSSTYFIFYFIFL